MVSPDPLTSSRLGAAQARDVRPRGTLSSVSTWGPEASRSRHDERDRYPSFEGASTPHATQEESITGDRQLQTLPPSIERVPRETKVAFDGSPARYDEIVLRGEHLEKRSALRPIATNEGSDNRPGEGTASAA